mmetsp:Transcript_26725/g.37894  ORF Transcript_26725/g.37894 Transcript_26725/m.37894 type:complete len:85 (-) Transcript_26725:194-448(-)
MYAVNSDPSLSASAVSRSSPGPVDLPSQAELPRRVADSANTTKQSKLLDIEMLNGRIAMIAAVLMMGNEMMMGTSIPEQLERFL